MAEREDIIQILVDAEQLVRELQRQVEEEGECAASILRLVQVRSLLDRAGARVLEHYLDDCWADLARMDPDRLLRMLGLFFRMMPAVPGLPDRGVNPGGPVGPPHAEATPDH